MLRVLLPLVGCLLAVQAGSVEEVFRSHQVVPDVIPEPPNQLLKVGPLTKAH